MLCINHDAVYWQLKELKHGGPTAYVVVDGVNRVVGLLCLACFKMIDREGDRNVLAAAFTKYGHEDGPYRPMSVRCVECGSVHDWAAGIAGMEPLKVWAPYDVCPECKRALNQSVRQEEMLEHAVGLMVEKMVQRNASLYGDAAELRRKLDEMVERYSRHTIEKETGTMSTTEEKTNVTLADRAMSMGLGLGIDRMGLRSGATLAVNLARKPLLAALRARMGKGKGREVGQFIRTAEAALQTDLGDGALRLVLSGAVRVVPGVPENVRAALADEFLVSGGSRFIDVVVDIFAGPVITAISGGVAVLADPEVTARMADGAKVAGQAIGVRAESSQAPVGG